MLRFTRCSKMLMHSKSLSAFWKNNHRGHIVPSVILYLHSLLLNCFSTVHATGNFQSCLPNLLQSLPSEQITTRRSRTSWDHLLPQTSHRNFFSTSTIRATHLMRSRFGREIMSHPPLATPRTAYVSPVTG